ncbi:hypothetical protein RD792_010609 [Penstemon davidsonii]|uniref:NAC domain-containing protein n=1 Tax=Penstemon davidsonii TaxID=160366 RepID=A0ABR0D2K2_9LAMI|nr:hypothetical protein RD792_010609 [Penstemon davidsonii]
MAATPKSTTILSSCRIAPPTTTTEQSLPVTFFDMLWLHFHPIQRLLFYEFPCSKTYFLQNIVPKFNSSLSQTLKHFLPLSGNLIYPINSNNIPKIHYVPGDSVPVTIAESSIESSDYFNCLTGNSPRNADEFYDFVPDLPKAKLESDKGIKVIPLFSVQLTLFPDSGICAGFTNHHALGDASSIVGFLKAWSSIAKLGGDEHHEILSATYSIPFYDRSVIKDSSGLAHTFWNQMELFKIEFPPLKFPTKNVRATYILQKNEVQKLKNLVLAKSTTLDPVLIHLSSFTITSAYVWTCLAKSAAGAGEEVDDIEPEYFCFAVDARARLDPPVPRTYFGNCVALVTTESTHGELKGENGFIIAVELIGEVISEKVNKKEELLRDSDKWMMKYGPKMIGKRCFGVSGSPKFDMYDMDFGWGKPKKFECVSIDGDGGAMSLCKYREFEGGLEIGLSLPKKKMEAFADVFYDGLKKSFSSMDPYMQQRNHNTQNNPMDYQQFHNHYGNANSRVKIVYVEDFPSGYRFQPTDDELIVYYLKKKIKNEPIPYSKIHEADIYKHNPQELSETFSHPGEKKWYFFTPRERKYLNGSRPNRAAGSGYWKATGADKAIHHNGELVGLKKSLVFYEGRPPKGKKTNWLMQEYKLDEWVLCRIYKRDGKKNKDSEQQTYEIPQESSRNEENHALTAYEHIGMGQPNQGVMNRLGIDLTQSSPHAFTEDHQYLAMDHSFANFNQNNNYVLPNSWENQIMQRVYPMEIGSEQKDLLEDWEIWQQVFHATGVYVNENDNNETTHESIAAQFEPPTNADALIDSSAAQFDPPINVDPFIDSSDPIFDDIVLDTDQFQQADL